MISHLSRLQSNSDRRSPRSQRRRKQSQDHAVERLEQRELLAAGTFAEFAGDLAAAGEVDSIPLGVVPANFVLPKKKAVLGFNLSAAIGSTLDPGTITLTAAVPKNKIKVSAQRIDVAPADNRSFLVAQAIPDGLTAAVRAEGSGTGAYTLAVYLVGDVNGDFAVTQADLNQIASLVGKRLGDAGYLAEADTNRDGSIDKKKDSKLAKQNLGVSTTLRPTPPGNRAPVFPPIGPLTVMPGGKLDVTLAATDPDGDTVMFSLTSDGLLPTGELDSMGHLSFAPMPDEIGSYQFTLAASDGQLETAQNVTLNVTADPVTTTRLSGVLLKTNQQPLAGVTMEVGPVTAVTAADGTFLLDFGAALPISDTLKVRTELLTGPETYPFIAEKLAYLLGHEVFANVNNVITRPIWLPALDMANAKQINPMQDMTVTTAAIPGMSVFIKAGTLMNQQGTPFNGLLSITEVPVDLTPAALPEGLFPNLVVTIQPSEMVFTQPAPVTFPNTGGWAPGVLMDLWSINPVFGEFEDVGDMMVSADGSVIETISGGIRNSSWGMPAPPPPPKPPNNPNNDDDG